MMKIQMMSAVYTSISPSSNLGLLGRLGHDVINASNKLNNFKKCQLPINIQKRLNGQNKLEYKSSFLGTRVVDHRTDSAIV